MVLEYSTPAVAVSAMEAEAQFSAEIADVGVTLSFLLQEIDRASGIKIKNRFFIVSKIVDN